jgi:chromate transporter
MKVNNWQNKYTLLELFLLFLRLGSIAFGGPVAHLSFFYQELVVRRHVVNEKAYMGLVAFCQSLPGPASSQVAIAIGMKQRGLLGGATALLGFLLPSVIMMIVAAYAIHFFAAQSHAAWLHGFKIAVAAVIAQAILQLGQRFCRGFLPICIALLAASFAIYWAGFIGQIFAILLGAMLGAIAMPKFVAKKEITVFSTAKKINVTSTVIALVLFGVPLINGYLNNFLLSFFNIFYRTGALVFGGGHVILPLLESQLVMTGWVSNNIFLTGYGIAQALPGPLFSFAAFLGTAIQGGKNGWLLGIFCVFAIYLPSFFLLVGLLPLWERWQQHGYFQFLLAGVNAAVVGLLIAAFYDPIWVTTIQSLRDLITVCVAFFLLQFLRWPQWLVVILCVISSVIIYA